MRNLKRALSLALAAAMLISLMVVGASAAEYGDAAQVSQTEAVEVLTGLGVVGGDQNGNYNPKATLTRAEFCVMIANALTGNTFDRTLFDDTATPFTDVQGHWGAAYIAYCYSNGIIAGTSATTFSPDNTLTAAQAAAILLMALGYNQNSEFAANGQFELNVTKWAQDAGLYKDLSVSATAGISRENTAKLIFNALTNTTPVNYGALAQAYYTVGTSAVEGKVYTGNQLDADPTGDTQEYKNYQSTLGYTNFDLVKGTGDFDSFGRPTSVWMADDDKIAEVSKTATFVYTADAAEDAVAKDLKDYKVYKDGGGDADTLVKATANGTAGDKTTAIHSKNGADAAAITYGTSNVAAVIDGMTKDGKLVEVYTNSDKVITNVIEITYTVDKVTSVTTTRDGDYQKTTYAGAQLTNAVTYTDPDKDDTAVLHGDVSKDDVVTFVKLGNVTHIYPTTVVVGTQTSFNAGKNTITVGGSTYTVGTGVTTNGSTPIEFDSFENSEEDANYYIDQYGYVVKTDNIASTDYAVIDAIMWSKSTTDLDATGAAIARLIFADGSTAQVTLNQMTYGGQTNKFAEDTNSAISSAEDTKHKVSSTQSANSAYEGLIVTYTVGSNDKYDLTVQNTKIDSADTKTTTADAVVVTKGVPALGDSLDITGNNKTIYIVKTEKSNGDAVYSSYTGYGNVPTVDMNSGKTATVSYVNGTSAAKFIFIDATAGSNVGDPETGDIIYIFDKNNYYVEGKDSNAKYIYEDVAVNGEIADLEVNSTVKGTIVDNGEGLYEVTTNDKGVVTAATKQTTADTTYIETTKLTADAADGIVGTYTYDGSETVYVIDGDTIYAGTAESALKDDTIYVKVVGGDNAADKIAIEVMYIVKAE